MHRPRAGLYLGEQVKCINAVHCHRHVGTMPVTRQHPSAHFDISGPQKMILRGHEPNRVVCCGVASGAMHDMDGSSGGRPQQDYTGLQSPVTKLWAGLVLLCACAYR